MHKSGRYLLNWVCHSKHRSDHLKTSMLLRCVLMRYPFVHKLFNVQAYGIFLCFFFFHLLTCYLQFRRFIELVSPCICPCTSSIYLDLYICRRGIFLFVVCLVFILPIIYLFPLYFINRTQGENYPPFMLKERTC